ncbi:MAG: hypothetical protein ABJM29_16920 [Rhizobiaceae bacterium]
MIEVVHMPLERNKFSCVSESVDLRGRSFLNEEIWIGQASGSDGALEDADHGDCFHVINRDGAASIGYARLVPVLDNADDETVSGTIGQLARQSNRCPAFELQCVSFTNSDERASADGETILRELIVETMRISNNRQCRFIYTTSDRGGTALLRKIGLKYSTLSAPFPVHGRPMVILCIAVTNSNIMALNPFKVVGGTQASAAMHPQEEALSTSPTAPTEFSRLEAIASLKDQCDPPSGPHEH